MITISAELQTDIPARELLLDRAFGPARHRKTSARLRAGRLPADGLSFVARDDTGRVIGTVRLWTVAIGATGTSLLLGPLAVDPSTQGTGIGAALMRHALAAAGSGGHGSVILVGDPDYYGRFGFSTAPMADVRLPGPVETHRFLGLELTPGALAGAAGLVRATGPRIGERRALRRSA